MFTFAVLRVVWMAWTATRSVSTPFSPMTVLLIILLATLALSIRAGLYGRRWKVAESDSAADPLLIETCARTFVLVLLSLLGLLALGLMYGNVLATHAGS